MSDDEEPEDVDDLEMKYDRVSPSSLSRFCSLFGADVLLLLASDDDGDDVDVKHRSCN